MHLSVISSRERPNRILMLRASINSATITSEPTGPPISVPSGSTLNIRASKGQMSTSDRWRRGQYPTVDFSSAVDEIEGRTVHFYPVHRPSRVSQILIRRSRSTSAALTAVGTGVKGQSPAENDSPRPVLALPPEFLIGPGNAQLYPQFALVLKKQSRSNIKKKEHDLTKNNPKKK